MITHLKSATEGDFTGTVTVFNSVGSTVTAAASDLVRPSDWNSAHAINYALGGNTSGSASVSGSDVALFGGAGVTLSADTANSRLYFQAGGAAPFTGSWFQPEVYGNTTALTMPNGSLFIRPFELDGYYDLDKYNFFHSFSSSRSTVSFTGSISGPTATSGTGTFGLTGTLLLFTRVTNDETNASYNSIISFDSQSWSLSAGYSASVSGSTNASSATISVSTSAAIGFLSKIDGNGGITTGSSGASGSTSFSSSSTAGSTFSSSYVLTFPYAHLSGMRAVFVQGDGTAIPPGEYWLGVQQSTTSGSTGIGGMDRLMADGGRLFFTASTNNYMEVGNSVAFTTSGIRPLYGSANVSSATTTAIALSVFSSISSHASLWFALDGRTK